MSWASVSIDGPMLAIDPACEPSMPAPALTDGKPSRMMLRAGREKEKGVRLDFS